MFCSEIQDAERHEEASYIFLGAVRNWRFISSKEFSLLHVEVGLSVLSLSSLRTLYDYYYYYYYLLQLIFHSVAVVVTLLTNKNKYI